MRYIGAELLAGIVIETKMLSCINPAESCFFRSCGKSIERPLHAGEDFGCHLKAELIASKKRSQHRRRGAADRRMGAWIGWIRRCIFCLRQPGAVPATADRRNRPPEFVGVFGV